MIKHRRRPDWLKVKLPGGPNYKSLSRVMDKGKLHTVCEEAKCPNLGECWGRGTATIMILGNSCTRDCGFCAVRTSRPAEIDPTEADRVAKVVEKMALKYAVITSVTRDDLADGGARMFANVIDRIRVKTSNCYIEILIPDFNGSPEALQTVFDARPDVLAHNLETVDRLYAAVRPQADYQQSLDVLDRGKQDGLITKSGIMIGIGERPQEVHSLMLDLRQIDCDIMTIGQYLQPTRSHLAVDRFVHPEEFSMYRSEGLRLGFKQVESGPLIRSSYHAEGATGLIEELAKQNKAV